MRTRREVLAATAAAIIAPKAGFAQAEPPKPRQLVINASGGSQIASLRQNYLNDFEKETGIKIVDTSPTDFGKLRAMVESGNVVWNITEIGGQDGYRVTQMGLAEPIDMGELRRQGQITAEPPLVTYDVRGDGFLRQLSLMLVLESDLQERSLSEIVCKPIYCVDLTGSGLRRLTSAPQFESHPAWGSAR